MKTTSRKRLLVSSVAMLLVAMLALGTATYAWFTQNTQATADKLSAKTIKASELKVSSKDITWTDALQYNINEVLKPVSTANGYDWFAATAANKTDSAADVLTAVKLSSTNKYAIVEQLNIQNQGGAAVENVKINFTLSETNSANSITNNKYLRVALVPVASAGFVPSTDEEKAAYATNFASHVYASQADSALAIKGITTKKVAETDDDDAVDQDGDGSTTLMTVNDKLVTENVTAVNAGTSTFSVPVKNLAAYGTPNDGDTAYFNLYVWFEGQDTNCSDAYAGNQMPTVKFTVSADNVAQN